jgi:hypothetical protein
MVIDAPDNPILRYFHNQMGSRDVVRTQHDYLTPIFASLNYLK